MTAPERDQPVPAVGSEAVTARERDQPVPREDGAAERHHAPGGRTKDKGCKYPFLLFGWVLCS
jgi:hypothetical protein